MPVKITYDEMLGDHWKQFCAACDEMGKYEMLVNETIRFNWREQVLWQMCKRHNEDLIKQGKEPYFLFKDE